MFLDGHDDVREVLPHGNLADALSRGNLLVAVTFVETHAEDASVLLRKPARHELHDVVHPFIFLRSTPPKGERGGGFC